MPSEFFRFLSPPYCFHFWIHRNRNREVTGWSFRMLFAPNHRLLRNMLQGLFRHSMMWLPSLRAYGSRILTSNGFLLPLSFIAAILSSQCQMLFLFRSNFVPQISFREASPFFYQKNKAKVNFSIIYSCFISWVFRLFESQFLQRVWNFWKIRKCIIYIKFSRSLPFTKWVIIFSQCRLN